METKVDQALKRKEEQLASKSSQHVRLLKQRKLQKQNLDLAMAMMSQDLQGKIEDKEGRQRPVTSTNQRAAEHREKLRTDLQKEQERMAEGELLKKQQFEERQKQRLEQAEVAKQQKQAVSSTLWRC